MNHTYVTAVFDPRPKGRFVSYNPSDKKGPLYIDRESKLEVLPNRRYLCRVLRTLTTGVRFVLVMKSIDEIFIELKGPLSQALWKRGPHITDAITATVESNLYGNVRAEWHETVDTYPTQALYLDLRVGDSKIKLTFDHTNPDVDLNPIAESVHVSTGEPKDVVAIIGRPAPWHRRKSML